MTNTSESKPNSATALSERLLSGMTQMEQAIEKLSSALAQNQEKAANSNVALQDELKSLRDQYQNLQQASEKVAARLEEVTGRLKKIAG